MSKSGNFSISVSALILFSGCASTMPDTTYIPVPVSCIEAMPERPQFATDAYLLTLADGPFVIALGIDRQERIKYINELTAILTACVK